MSNNSASAASAANNDGDFRTVPAESVRFSSGTALPVPGVVSSIGDNSGTLEVTREPVGLSDLPPPPMPPIASVVADFSEIEHSLEADVVDVKEESLPVIVPEIEVVEPEQVNASEILPEVSEMISSSEEMPEVLLQSSEPVDESISPESLVQNSEVVSVVDNGGFIAQEGRLDPVPVEESVVESEVVEDREIQVQDELVPDLTGQVQEDEIKVEQGVLASPLVQELGGTNMAMGKPSDLVELLEYKGVINHEKAEEIRFKHVQTGMSQESILLEENLVSSEQLKLMQAELNGIPIIDLAKVAVSPEALAFIPQSVAERFGVLAYDYVRESNLLLVAMADPMDLDAVDFLQKKTRTILQVSGVLRDELYKTLKERYGVSLSSEVKQVLRDTDLGSAVSVNPTEALAAGVIREAPISKIVAYVLEYAMKTRASDVHIEPQEDRTRIRYRIDGILLEKLVLPKKVQDALVSRIKILSDLKIDEKRLPQDGRFNFKALDQEVDLRVSTLPTVNGEKVVMRLLKKSGGAATLQELGLRGRALKVLEESIAKPHGIILVTGPTGSGKTTTLYSALTKLNNPKVNIMTLEDPVEYQMVGINQVQVNAQIGLTFASGLRSFLRQDPNIIMVGEIRDSETANLAIQASLTGHLVLSTLHTNNSAGAMPRLLDMGAESFLLASTMVAVAAQRVVRVICANCKKQIDPPAEKLANMKEVLGRLYPRTELKLYEGVGCEECGNSGYKGRVAIFEMLPVTEKIARMILERESAAEIEKMAIEDGMVTMKQDGYLKVIEGITTVEEVLRVADV